MEEILNSLDLYLRQITEPMNFIDILIEVIVPVLPVLILVITSIISALRYFKTKNIEVYEKILKEVYAPLYQYFVKQETYAIIAMENRNISYDSEFYKESPVLEIVSDKKIERHGSTNYEKTLIFGMERRNIIKIKENINAGLATEELYTLLNIYEMLVMMENKFSDKIEDYRYLQATCIKVDIENALRKEVFIGYKKYLDKLGLEKNTEIAFWSKTDDQIFLDNILKDNSYIENNFNKLRIQKVEGLVDQFFRGFLTKEEFDKRLDLIKQSYYTSKS